MPDLDNVTPVNGGADGAADDQPVIENAPGTDNATDEGQNGPPPSNEERKAAKEAKEATEKEAKEKAAAAEEGAEEGEGEGDETEDKELDTETWGDPGSDDVGRETLTLIQNSGLKPEEALELFGKAREAMDPSLVDRDALVEKVGKNKATLIMAGFENVASREKARVAEVTETVNKAAGSAENWKKAAGWAVKNLPEGELAELRGMLDKGGRQAQFAAGEIIARFNDDPKNTALNAGAGQVKPDGKAGSAVKPITRRQYGEMLDKLHRTRGSEAEFAALKAQRQAGIKAGI